MVPEHNTFDTDWYQYLSADNSKRWQESVYISLVVRIVQDAHHAHGMAYTGLFVHGCHVTSFTSSLSMSLEIWY